MGTREAGPVQNEKEEEEIREEERECRRDTISVTGGLMERETAEEKNEEKENCWKSRWIGEVSKK